MAELDNGQPVAASRFSTRFSAKSCPDCGSREHLVESPKEGKHLAHDAEHVSDLSKTPTSELTAIPSALHLAKPNGLQTVASRDQLIDSSPGGSSGNMLTNTCFMLAGNAGRHIFCAVPGENHNEFLSVTQRNRLPNTCLVTFGVGLFAIRLWPSRLRCIT